MRSHLVAAFAVLTAACGGNVDNPGTQPGSDSGADTLIGDSTPDSSPDVAIDAGPIPLDKLCSALADARCGSEGKTCCEKSTTFKEAGCREAVTKSCTRAFDTVKAGRATYDETKAGACAVAWRTALTKCDLPAVEKARLTGVCGAMFKGTVMPDQSCMTSVECIAPEGAAGSCSEGKCSVIGVTSTVGTGCLDLTCDFGLYCAVLEGAVCKTAVPLGSPCSTDAPMSCGAGNSCIAGKCAEGKPGGATCTTSTGEGWDCASWDCRVSMQKCAPFATTIADAIWCGGA